MIVLALALCACAETRIYENDHLVAVIQGDATNVSISTGKTSFHADRLNHSQVTLAHGKVVSGIMGQLTGIATLLRVILPFLP